MHFEDTFAFDLISPDGNAHLVCSELPLDIRHEISTAFRQKKEDVSSEVFTRYQRAMCESVLSVEGLEDSKGPVTGARVRELKISARLLDIISSAYWAALAAKSTITEKKSDSSEESKTA